MLELALPLFENGIHTELPPLRPETRRIFEAIAHGDMASALKLSATAIHTSPEDSEAIYARAVTLYLTASFGTARPLFEKVIRNGPSFADCDRIFYLYGMCLLRLGEAESAREALLVHLQLQPGGIETRIALGELTLQEGDPDSALVHFRFALQSLPSLENSNAMQSVAQAKAQAGIGKALLQLDQVEEAHKAIQLCLQLDPSQAQPYYALSRIYMRQGKHEQAKQAFDQFRRLSAQH
ncbi:MAG: tetratricopeptide repeat protein [Planctomycetes bacterium]|nr:tetratricopeptide repeat protein [Planctomycetota bacterium]